MNLLVKEKLYQFCERYVEDRSARIKSTIVSLQEALSSETKSSAGDKHETGRAMIQLEREKLGQQLAEVQLLQELLKKIPLKASNSHVGLGSLVFTSQKNYYLGISAGEIKVDEVSYYTIAPNTPIGKLLVGRVVGDVIMFNAKEIKVSKII